MSVSQKQWPRYQQVILFILPALSLFLVGCGGVDDSSGPPVSTTESASPQTQDGENFQRTLSATANNVILPTYEAFATETAGFAEDTGALAQYCQAIGTAGEANLRNTAQSQFQSLLSIWQEAEAFLVGPVTDNSDNTRQQIYSWPGFISTCTIDRHVILAEDSNYEINNAPRQALGLDTLEYLLYSDNLNHTCPSQIIETQGWDDRNEDAKKQARCDYAQLVSQALASTAATLEQQWTAEGNNYAQQLVNSGLEDDTAFDSQTEALNALSDALFYVEKEVKDRKLGVPLGLHRHCLSTTCPDDIESPYSDQALAHIRQNLVGFRALFLGSRSLENSTNLSFENTLGFNYILATRNFPDVSDSILTRTDSAIARIDHYTGTLNSAVNALNDAQAHANCVNTATTPEVNLPADSPLNLCALHGELKAITDELRGNFLTIVSLALPTRVEGDND